MHLCQAYPQISVCQLTTDDYFIISKYLSLRCTVLEFNFSSGNHGDGSALTGIELWCTVKDKASRLSEELSKLQAEADRIARLLRFADPSGEAARKWDGNDEDSSRSRKVETMVENRLRLRASKEAARELASQAKEALDSGSEVIAAPSTVDVSMDSVDEKVEAKEMPTLAPTLRLGAPQPEAPQSAATTTSISIEQDTEAGNEFVGYKDRKRPVSKEDLIQVEEATGENRGSEDRDVASSAAMEAIALLMRHKTGLTAQEELQEEESRTNNSRQHPGGTKTRGKKKRKLGPERPPTMVKEADELEEAWVPPQGSN